MALLQIIGTEVVTFLLEYLGAHGRLLETASLVRCSVPFVWAAATQQNFHLFKVPMHLRTDALCRHALRCSRGRFNWLWASIPETFVTADLMAWACVHRDYATYAYNHVPPEVRASEAFARALVSHAEQFDPDSESDATPPNTWIPDDILAANRDLALQCAQKGISPFGTEEQLNYVADQEIVEAFLKAREWCEAHMFEKFSRSAWCNRDWMLMMCREAPATAACFLNQSEDDACLQREIIQTVPRDLVYQTMNINSNRSVDEAIWRIALCRDPRVIGIIGSWCRVLPSDEHLLTRVFRENPWFYGQAHAHISSIVYVARIVFAHDGRQIKHSRLFQDQREMALLAVGQNGLALKYISERLRCDPDTVMAAVHQNGLALAWVGAPYMLTDHNPVAQAALRQNPAAAAFLL